MEQPFKKWYMVIDRKENGLGEDLKQMLSFWGWIYKIQDGALYQMVENLAPTRTETKSRHGTTSNWKASAQQSEQSREYKNISWNGTKYLQSIYLIKGCYGLSMVCPNQNSC
jgi:hypothetical protein